MLRAFHKKLRVAAVLTDSRALVAKLPSGEAAALLPLDWVRSTESAGEQLRQIRRPCKGRTRGHVVAPVGQRTGHRARREGVRRAGLDAVRTWPGAIHGRQAPRFLGPRLAGYTGSTMAVGFDMHYSVTSFFVLAVAALATGCASTAGSPTSPSAGSGSPTLTAEQLGGTWTLSSLQPAAQTEQAVPAGATYELTLGEGRVSTRADCNVCNGALVLSGQTVTIGPILACTRAACATMAFETTYVAVLAGDSVARVDGVTLTLTSSRGTLRFLQRR